MSAVASADVSSDVEPQPGIVERTTDALKTVWRLKHAFPVLIYTILSYYTVGPRLQSWPLETAVAVAMFPALGGLQGNTGIEDPVKSTQAQRKQLATMTESAHVDPSYGTCTQVNLRVPRQAEGLLAPLATKEDGSRTVGAEWQIHDSARKGSASDRVLLYLHGGGYTLMSPRSHRELTLELSKKLNCRVLSVDYRLAPETVFPGALFDAFAAYSYLTQDLKISASNIYVGGDSAGGGLSLALLLYIRDSKLPTLGGAILFSPWSDMTSSMRSWEDNAGYDYITEADALGPRAPAQLYLSPSFTENVTHPYVSPCLAPTLASLPPLLIQAGEVEVLRDEITLLAQRAHLAGVDVKHQILGAAVHVGQLLPHSDVGRVALTEVEKWIKGRDARVEPVEWTVVDALFEAAQKDRVNVHKGTRNTASAPKFVFDGVHREAPTVNTRNGAHAIAEKVVDDHQGKNQLVSTLFVPKRNSEAMGILGKLRGSF